MRAPSFSSLIALVVGGRVQVASSGAGSNMFPPRRRPKFLPNARQTTSKS
jgi:hypothetical protein